MATTEDKPLDMSKELAKLKHEKKNQGLHRLPPNTSIRRRPMNHPPIASPYAGADVQKVVYVTTKTPIMAAVKKVKKLLHHIERRATHSVDILKKDDRAGLAQLAELREKMVKNGEEVLVKASGRAMAQALRVGDWFQKKEKELLCKVEVRTGSVSVVDDIVEEDLEDEKEDEHEKQNTSTFADGDTTMELFAANNPSSVPIADQNTENAAPTTKSDEGQQKRKRKRKKKPMYDKDDLPEARLRWVKTVEVAISLRA